MTTVQRHLESETENLDKIDRELFVSLLRGAIGGADELRGHFEPLLSRPLAELSPIEHAILLLGAYELHQNIDTPYRVVINEAIETVKREGHTKGKLIALAPPIYIDGWATLWYCGLRPLLYRVPGVPTKMKVEEEDPFGIKNEQLRAIVKAKFKRDENFHYG